MVQCEKTKEGLYMVEITYSQRKMLKHILKAGEKGVRWDKLEKKFGEIAAPKELLELTQQGLLKALGASGDEWDLHKPLPNPPKPNELYAVCTITAKSSIERDDELDKQDRDNRIMGIAGVLLGIAGTVLGIAGIVVAFLLR